MFVGVFLVGGSSGYGGVTPRRAIFSHDVGAMLSHLVLRKSD